MDLPSEEQIGREIELVTDMNDKQTHKTMLSAYPLIQYALFLHFSLFSGKMKMTAQMRLFWFQQ